MEQLRKFNSLAAELNNAILLPLLSRNSPLLNIEVLKVWVWVWVWVNPNPNSILTRTQTQIWTWNGPGLGS